MTSLGELLSLHDRLTTMHVERWVARGLLRPSGAGDAWAATPIHDPTAANDTRKLARPQDAPVEIEAEDDTPPPTDAE